jgi:hypothetical protein
MVDCQHHYGFLCFLQAAQSAVLKPNFLIDYHFLASIPHLDLPYQLILETVGDAVAHVQSHITTSGQSDIAFTITSATNSLPLSDWRIIGAP